MQRLIVSSNPCQHHVFVCSPNFSVNGFHDSSMAAYSPRDCTVRIWRKQTQVCSKNSRLSLVSDTLSSAAHACAPYSSTMRQVSRLGALVSILQSSKYWQGHKSPVFTSITIGHDGFNGQRWISYLDLIKWEMRTCERANGTREKCLERQIAWQERSNFTIDSAISTNRFDIINKHIIKVRIQAH
jgi:hypothetical protein